MSVTKGQEICFTVSKIPQAPTEEDSETLYTSSCELVCIVVMLVCVC